MALPGLPQLRIIDGPIGIFLKEIRGWLASIKDVVFISGKEVSITFSATDVAGAVVKRTLTGLGYPPSGFYIYRGHNGSSLIESSAPSTETDKTVLYLRATIAGTYSIWVF